MTHVHTVGCRVNQYESHWLAEQLAQANSDRPIHVVNTCAVTGLAERKGRQLVRQLRRTYPQALIVAVGCQAELDPEGLRAAGADAALGNKGKERLPAQLAEGLDEPDLLEAEWASLDRQAVTGAAPRARATVKVQDGCAGSCTFCVTRTLRGPLRSKSPDVVAQEVKALCAAGHQEIVLAGVDLAAYGRGAPEGLNLIELLRNLLCIPGVRYRLSSIGPAGISNDLVHLMADEPRLCPHLHVPLQSGDDALLRAMRRGYTAAEYEERVHSFLDSVPNATFGTDLMVGFPGESEQAFQRSLGLLERLRPLNAHVFRFSPRPGTPAAALRPRVTAESAAARARAAWTAAQRWSVLARLRFIGHCLAAVPEGEQDGWSQGYTENYIRLVFAHEATTQGTITPVRLAYVDAAHTLGVKEDRETNL